MPLDPLLVRKLTIAREMLAKAAVLAGESSALGPAQGISACQDAIELILRGVIEFHDIKIPNRGDFEDLIKEIGKHGTPPMKVPHHPRLTQINKARVNFKHLGIVPDAAQAREMVEFASLAADEICKACMGVSLWEATAVQLIRKTRVRNHLSRAVNRFEMGLYTEACDACGMAFALVFGEVRRDTTPRFNADSLQTRHFDSFGGFTGRREPDISEVARSTKEDIEKLATELVRLGDQIALLRLGINADGLTRFENTVPRVSVFHGRISVHRNPRFQPDKEDAAFALQFVLEAILRCQGDIAPYKHVRGSVELIKDSPILASYPSPPNARVKFFEPPETIRIAKAGETFSLIRSEGLGGEVVEMVFEGDVCYIASADVTVHVPPSQGQP